MLTNAQAASTATEHEGLTKRLLEQRNTANAALQVSMCVQPGSLTLAGGPGPPRPDPCFGSAPLALQSS